MQNSQARKLTFGAMMIAIFAILLVLAFYVPIVSMVAALFVVLPIAWYSALYDRVSSILLAIAGCIIAFIIGSVQIVPFALVYAVLAVVIGDAIRRKQSKLYLFMSASMMCLLVVSVMYFISVQFFDVDIVKESIAFFEASFRESMEMVKGQLGNSLEKQYMASLETMEYIVPAIVTVSVFVSTWIILLLNLPILRRLGLDAPKFAPFKDMRLPRSVMWYYLIVLCISLVGKPEVGGALYVIILNLSVVLWILFVLQGISLLFYYIHEKRLSKFAKVVVVLLSIPLYSFVMLIGILDLGFNIRSYITGKNNK